MWGAESSVRRRPRIVAITARANTATASPVVASEGSYGAQETCLSAHARFVIAWQGSLSAFNVLPFRSAPSCNHRVLRHDNVRPARVLAHLRRLLARARASPGKTGPSSPSLCILAPARSGRFTFCLWLRLCDVASWLPHVVPQGCRGNRRRSCSDGAPDGRRPLHSSKRAHRQPSRLRTAGHGRGHRGVRDQRVAAAIPQPPLFHIVQAHRWTGRSMRPVRHYRSLSSPPIQEDGQRP